MAGRLRSLVGGLDAPRAPPGIPSCQSSQTPDNPPADHSVSYQILREGPGQQILNQPDRRQRTLSGPEEKFPHPPQPSAPVGDLDEDDTDEEDETGATRAVREEDVSILRNHVQKQAEEISFQKDIIAQVRNELQKQKEHTRRVLTKVENEDVFLLERELRKH
ncbi:unnamed protein product [Penicillium viridicatum]